MSQIVWTEVDSSNVKSIAFDDETETLCVQFERGGLYTYQGVDHEVYVSLVHAESVGRYLNDIVKPNYPYTKYFNELDLVNDLHDMALLRKHL